MTACPSLALSLLQTGWTALTLALWLGHAEVAQLLHAAWCGAKLVFHTSGPAAVWQSPCPLIFGNCDGIGLVGLQPATADWDPCACCA